MRARPTSTRRRMRTSPRMESARRPSNPPRSRVSIRAALLSAATTRSADGWSSSSPRSASASASGWSSRRRENRRTSGLIAAGATWLAAMSACSSPAAPAMLSRIISVQEAIASVLATVLWLSEARRAADGDGTDSRHRGDGGDGPSGDAQDDQRPDDCSGNPGEVRRRIGDRDVIARAEDGASSDALDDEEDAESDGPAPIARLASAIMRPSIRRGRRANACRTQRLRGERGVGR